jgi:hypothetical protein
MQCNCVFSVSVLLLLRQSFLCCIQHKDHFYILYKAHISGRQTPGLTWVHPPHLLYKGGGVNSGLNLGFGVLRCELCVRVG